MTKTPVVVSTHANQERERIKTCIHAYIRMQHACTWFVKHTHWDSLWAIQRLNLTVLQKTLRDSIYPPAPCPSSLITWVSRSTGPPTLWTPSILATSPLLATLFIRTQITASSFQLSILLLWSGRNAYRCLSRGELQASSRRCSGREGTNFLLLFLGAVSLYN